MCPDKIAETFVDEGFAFPTPYKRYPRKGSIAGSRVEPVYSAFYNADGVLELEVTGKRDIYDEIQSHKDSVDINVILKRFAMGETDVLERVQGFYDDVTKMPKTYQEVLNCVIQSEDFFNSLPASEKQKFNNSFTEFMIAAGKDDFISNFVQPVTEVPEPVEVEKEADTVEQE